MDHHAFSRSFLSAAKVFIASDVADDVHVICLLAFLATIRSSAPIQRLHKRLS
jgi:hypothetical protein